MSYEYFNILVLHEKILGFQRSYHWASSLAKGFLSAPLLVFLRSGADQKPLASEDDHWAGFARTDRDIYSN